MRVLLALAIFAAVPASLLAQADTTFAGWVRFRPGAALALRPPVALAGPLGGLRRPAAERAAAWDRDLAIRLDSVRALRATAWRLRRIYGRSAAAALEAEEEPEVRRHNLLGLSRKTADLNIDGNARLELRTERLKNLRCTPAQLLDINSGCRGSFKTPRLDTFLNVRAGGLVAQRLHLDIDYDTERDFSARNNLQVYYEGLEDEVVQRVEVGSVTFRPPQSRFITAAIPANNFGVNASFEVGALQLQAIAATQKGSVVAERTYTIGSTTVQPQDREARDLDFEAGRFFWVVDPATVAGYPALDILEIRNTSRPPALTIAQGDVRVYRYRPASRNGVNPSLGGITAAALTADTLQKVTGLWDLLVLGTDYYLDDSGLWVVLASRLDQNDYLAVSYRSGAGLVGTFPATDTPVAPGAAPRDTLRLVVEPRVGPGAATFRHEIRSVYRVAGADLDPASLKVNLSLNRSERPLRPGAQATYLAELGLATPNDPNTFNSQDRLFPRTRDAGADATIKESYIVLPSLQPFGDPARLLATERNDSLYRTPGYLLFSEGPPAKFVFRLRYNASSSGDRSTLDLGAFQIRNGSDALFVGGRRLERGLDYNISYDLGQVTFLNPQALFGSGSGGVTVQARFEEQGIFAVAPTQIFGVATRYSLGQTGGINLMGIYQKEQSAFNRPQLGFEASANLVGGVSADLRFKPQAVTRFLNRLTSSPATAPSALQFNGELALTKPDPNQSGQAYLEEFEGDNGIPVSLRESGWEFGSRPQYPDGVTGVVGAAFDTADAVQLTWQNLVPACNGCGPVQLRVKDIDPRVQVAGQQDQLESVLFLTLHADTAGGIVRRNSSSRWSLPQRQFKPRWRSLVTPLSTTGVDLSKNEFLEFWLFQPDTTKLDSAGVSLVVDLGAVNEDAVALAPDTILFLSTPNGPDTAYAGRHLVGQGRLDTEREPTGIFNAESDDIGILGDRPDSLIRSDGEAPIRRLALCQRQLGNVVPVFPWGDLSSRCTNGNGSLDAEDLDGDNQLNASGAGDNVYRWVVDLRDSPYFVRDGVPSQTSPGGWKLYRLPLRAPEFSLGSPNIRLIRQLRIAVVAEPDQGAADNVAFFAVARMKFTGSPWVRRSDRPVASLAGATSGPLGEVVASTISTEDVGYTSPPGVVGGVDRKGGSQGEFGTQINERALRIVARQIARGQRAEAYYRFPSGPQNLLRYRELRGWVRGAGAGWGPTGDYRAYIRVGSDSRNFYQFLQAAEATTWDPEVRVDLEIWRNLKAQIESRRLQNIPADSAARVACGGDSLSTAYVLCSGPYLVHIQDPAVSPPNLAAVQEIAAGLIRVDQLGVADSAELWVDDLRLVEPISNLGTALALDLRLVASDVADLSLGYVRQDGFFQQIGADPSYRTTGTFQMASGMRLERFLPTRLGIVMPVQVSYARAEVNPQLLTGTDIRGSDLQRLRKPASWTLNYSVALRRSARGRSWLVRGLVDPVALNASVVSGRSTTELSEASTRGHFVNATYSLFPGRKGVALDLGGLVDRLPGFLRRSDGAQAARRPVLTPAPTAVRLTSGVSRSESDLTAYAVPVRRAADSALGAVTSLDHTWRNSAGLTWQPLGMLSLSGDLASTRDLRQYSDSTSLGRLARESRRTLLGVDVGVERTRQVSTQFALTPRIASWVRPRYVSTSAFVLARSLASRDPIRAVGDTAGEFLLPQTLNNSRSNEIGAAIDLSRLLARAFGDSSGVARATRRVRLLDVAERRTRTSTYDLAAFDPSFGYQLALGGLDRFLSQEGQQAIGASEIRATTFTAGADLPLGLSLTAGYSRTRTSRFQRAGSGFLQTDVYLREWPRGSIRATRTFRRSLISLVGLGASLRRLKGYTVLPSVSGQGSRTANRSLTVTPDAQVTLRNGMVFTFSYSQLDQESEGNGNLTRLGQDNLTGALNYVFRMPRAVSRLRKNIRSQLSAVLSKSVTCLQRATETNCATVSDTRRREVRASLDTDLARTLTGGLQFSYSVNDARHLDRKFSQIILTASFQLSLFSADYR